MRRGTLEPLRGGAALLRLVLVVVALAWQIGGGGLVSAPGDAPESPAGLLAAASVFCQSGQHTSAPGTPVPHRHVPEQAIVSLVCADSQSAALLDGAPPLPKPPSGTIGRDIALPGARAPPAHYVTASLPRGPPGNV